MGLRADRRTVLAGAAGLAGAAVAPAALAAARRPDALRLYDPADTAALTVARTVWPAMAGAVAIEGERIPFAHQVFAAQPSQVLAVTRWADCVLLTEVAEEAGYRTAVLDRIGPGRSVFLWRAERPTP
jgi:hypothetical protein